MTALLRHPRFRPAAAALILTYLPADLLAPSAFGIASVLTGLAVAATGAALGAQRIIATAPAALLTVAGIALALTGVGVDGSLFVGLATSFTVLGAIGVFLIGTATDLPAPLRSLLGAAGAVALVGHFSVVAGADVARLVPYPVLAAVFLLGVLRLSTPSHADEMVPA